MLPGRPLKSSPDWHFQNKSYFERAQAGAGGEVLIEQTSSPLTYMTLAAQDSSWIRQPKRAAGFPGCVMAAGKRRKMDKALVKGHCWGHMPFSRALSRLTASPPVSVMPVSGMAERSQRSAVGGPRAGGGGHSTVLKICKGAAEQQGKHKV